VHILQTAENKNRKNLLSCLIHVQKERNTVKPSGKRLKLDEAVDDKVQPVPLLH
jgi:hypothetical protein